MREARRPTGRRRSVDALTWIAAAAVLGLVGCQSPPGPTRVHPQGAYTHEFTGLVFPEQVLNFERLYVTEYGPDKADVSGHYQGAVITPTTATVYHYPATADASPPTAEQFIAHYEQVKGDVLRGTPGANLTGEEWIETLVNGFVIQGAHAVYAFPGFGDSTVASESHLFLYAIDGWYLKFRFTHPDRVSGQAVQNEIGFIESMSWPTGE